MSDVALVADIGGTNARFAVSYSDGERVSLDCQRSYKACDFDTINDATAAYLNSVDEAPRTACFGVAGPILDDCVTFSNSRWQISKSEMCKQFGLKELHLVNDFFALSSGVLVLNNDGRIHVRSGTAVKGAPMLVIGPGTGLGQAIIANRNGDRFVISTEGGHRAFTPATPEENAIYNIVSPDGAHIPAERLISGPGILEIYNAICTVAGADPEFTNQTDITKAAMQGENSLALRTVTVFCEMLGGFVGDTVLAAGALGGVVLGGGVLPMIQPILTESRFSDRFTAKGIMSHYLQDVPVDLIVAENTALLGAAHLAKTEISADE